jgi:hypothetical protein
MGKYVILLGMKELVSREVWEDMKSGDDAT